MINDNGNNDKANKLTDTIWANDSISIKETDSDPYVLFDNESKMIKPIDFNVTNKSNIFRDALAFKGIGIDSDANSNNSSDINLYNDDDYLVFKKEDLIINKPKRLKSKSREINHRNHITKQNYNITTDNPKLEVAHCVLSDPEPIYKSIIYQLNKDM